MAPVVDNERMMPTQCASGESRSLRSEPRTVWPPIAWLKGYNPSLLTHDVVAGITLAAYAIPVSLAYASLAGVPPHYGIYCYLVGGIGYALFGTSRQLAIGPT